MSDIISTSEARGAVEKWLLQVQDVMLVSIKDIIERALQVGVVHLLHKQWLLTSNHPYDLLGCAGCH